MTENSPYEATMMRVEHKYLLTKEQFEVFLERALPHLKPDLYSEYDLCNVYFDTSDNAIVINSMNGPVFKEKLRLRSYGGDSPVFLEIKRKVNGIVVKRRISVDKGDVPGVIAGEVRGEGQIANEIGYFVRQRGVMGKVFIGYHRMAFSGKFEGDLRVTFDTDICYREEPLSLEKTGKEKLLWDDDRILMEIKASNSYPLWLAKILSEMKIFRQTFSKYGEVYAALKGG